MKRFLVLISLLHDYFFFTVGESCLRRAEHYFRVDSEDKSLCFFENFSRFEDLQLDCNRTYDNISENIAFLPRGPPLVIDKSFLLTKIVKKKRISDIHSVLLVNIAGIDLHSAIVHPRSVSNLKKDYALNLFYSRFNVYNNGKPELACTPSAFNSSVANFLTAFNSIFFRQVAYPSPSLCPLLFRNTDLDGLYFLDITNSFLLKNPLRFTRLNVSKDFEMRMPYFEHAYFEFKYERLSLTTMDVHVFKNTVELFLHGILDNIEPSLFGEFARLKLVNFKVSNQRELFHRGNAWLPLLNSHIRVNTARVNDVRAKLIYRMALLLVDTTSYTSFKSVYTFPDEDLCLFRGFPHEHLVVPYVYTDKPLPICTCTLKWLFTHVHAYEQLMENVRQDIYIDYNGKDKYVLPSAYVNCKQAFATLSCDFSARFNNCKLATFSGKCRVSQTLFKGEY